VGRAAAKPLSTFWGRPQPHSNVRDPISYCMLMLDKVRLLAEEFDILHFHIDQYHFPLFREMAGRTVTTLSRAAEPPMMEAAGGSVSATARTQ
jgi:hypothetical protein